MNTKDFTTNLVKIYFFICDMYQKDLQYSCQRFSNNQKSPVFTDQEVMTIYLYCVSEERRFTIQEIYQFTRNHLHSWFPCLPSYVCFTRRLNRLHDAFTRLCEHLMMVSKKHTEQIPDVLMLDSMPIITCSGRRTGKVAAGTADKGYCATKNLWYYGIKLHALTTKSVKGLPCFESIVLSEASENDLNIFKQHWSSVKNKRLFGDKIYHDPCFFREMEKNLNTQMCTPVKKKKGASKYEIERNRAFNDLFSRAVSAIRQLIESLFNWIIQKTDIQRAGKVRSLNGLLTHVFGKLAACFIYRIF